ncbi:MAG: SCO family protein [Gemmatimonadaceae bacterium]|nr:SCO family protein [Gemmatimonadaceae bacterium]
MTRALTLLATAALALAAACSPELKGEAVTPARDLPAYEFTRADGSHFSTGPSKDQLTVLFFGYTHCPDICPTTLADWKRVHAKLGDDTAKVRFVFVSIDPERDTPAIAQQYAAGYHPSFIGLAGDTATVWRMVKTFGVAVIPDDAQTQQPMPVPMPSGPSMANMQHMHGADTTKLIGHSSQAFLLNRKGQLVAMYPPGTGWQTLLADLQALL